MIYNTTTIEKYLFPLLQFTIKTTPEGKLTASFRKYVSEIEEVKPYTFRPVTGVRAFHGDQVFVKNPEGHVTHYYLANAPFMPFKQIPFHATTRFTDMVKIICIAVFLSVFIWPVRAIIRKRGKLKEIAAPILGQIARWITGSAAILMLLFVLLLSMMMNRTNLVERFLTSIPVPPALTLLLVMPVIAAALTLFIIPLNVLAWVKKYWTFQNRIHYTLVTAAFVAFMWWLDFYNLLGWRF